MRITVNVGDDLVAEACGFMEEDTRDGLVRGDITPHISHLTSQRIPTTGLAMGCTSLRAIRRAHESWLLDRTITTLAQQATASGVTLAPESA